MPSLEERRRGGNSALTRIFQTKETSKVVQLIIRTRGIELHSYHNTKNYRAEL